MSGPKSWYETAFDEDYPIYQAAEEGWTPVQALSVETLLNLPARARILDMACGYGRHSKLWREEGHAAESGPKGIWVRGDVRHLPFTENTFDAVASLFTSFGYFESRQEDGAALREALRVLGAGGGFYLDLKNPAHLRENFRETGSLTVGEAVIRERVRFTEAPGGPRVEMDRELTRPGRPPSRSRYSVRIYERGDLQSLLEEAGFV
ncbi:MAG: class I SAM-dependent methyltransferase, partial [Nitrospinota bacterium]|nr:class I SAM-dependent methyltransferase [Nitrospinota bacterium]